MGFMTIEHDRQAQLTYARREGFAEGEAEEAARYNHLIDALLDASRLDDLRRAANDESFRNKLFRELEID